ncbi:MAG: bifunctional phosphoribosylaminoimidazolecarboxamide formyltransferase/IMP cyclohydrolase [Candidatus Hydrothermia bacterium]|nr:bifunctional phosphoribosylaminoimidazolecarboxamide formyltransferase/IMP cyclohydrolase [Candidatus Hydrothermia bacterium]
MKKFALFSVFYKDGVERLAYELNRAGYEILATKGTAEYLNSKGIETIKVEDLVEFPESPGGRVKTLHPMIFSGILARRDYPEDMDYIERNKIPLINFVIVNLYPFSEKKSLDLKELLEFIDIGGVSLIRAAVKNYRWITLVCDPSDYDMVSTAVAENNIDMELRERLALKGFQKVLEYDAVIYSELSRRLNIETSTIPMLFSKARDLRYGENPHQKGYLFRNLASENTFFNRLQILGGAELSYNNIVDAASAWQLVNEFSEPACAIIKHNVPCGVGIGNSLFEAYEKALKSDEASAYGGIVAFNGTVEDYLAEAINRLFFEVILAKDFSSSALEIFKRKKRRRVLKVSDGFEHKLDYRFIDLDLLVQEKDTKPLRNEDLNVVSGELNEEWINDIIFGDVVVKYVKSNAIVLVRDRMTVGIGGGQTSRVDALKIAVEKAGDRSKGAILVSDGFFPFTDSIEIAYKYGIKLIVEPGGSVKDEEIINRAKELGLNLVFTGIRRFRH